VISATLAQPSVDEGPIVSPEPEGNTMADQARNKELVQSFWLSRPDRKAAYLAEDATWHLPTSIGTRMFGHADLHGEEARSIFMLAATDTYEPGGTIDILHVLADEDLVSLHCEVHTRIKGGADYHGAYHMLFRIEGEQIAEVWEFLDTAHQAACVATAAGSAPGSA
jgi:ketosteroid isomerase-like protein